MICACGVFLRAGWTNLLKVHFCQYFHRYWYRSYGTYSSNQSHISINCRIHWNRSSHCDHNQTFLSCKDTSRFWIFKEHNIRVENNSNIEIHLFKNKISKVISIRKYWQYRKNCLQYKIVCKMQVIFEIIHIKSGYFYLVDVYCS